ncbi:hypothetical protein D9M72_421640 [compost metagenome]
MEDEVERAVLADLRADLGLDVLEDLRAQLHAAGLVHAVHVAEGQGGDVAAVLAGAEGFDGGQGVFHRGVELLVDLVFDAVFLAADRADLDLEDHLGSGGALQQFTGDAQVFLQGLGGAVPHVRVEDRVASGLNLGLRSGQQRQDKAVQLVLGAVVRVQRDVDAVVLGYFAGECREAQGAGNHVLGGGTGPVRCAAGGNLDDAVGLCLGEAAQGRVQRLRGRDVDCRESEAARLCAVDHLGVDLWGCNGHADS